MKKLTCIICIVAFLSFLFFSLNTKAQVLTEVKSTSELLTAVSTAKPGDEIILEDGNFNGETIRFSAKGTVEKSIIIKAKNIGNASFSVPVKIDGEYLSMEGIRFSEKGNLEISGKN